MMVFGRRDGKIKGRFFFPCRGLGAWEYERKKRNKGANEICYPLKITLKVLFY
jgi:hypothetical protein